MREHIRCNDSIVICNQNMLVSHLIKMESGRGIFKGNLSTIVVDEAHKAHGVIFYFEAMFCLFNIENDIDWDALYDATLNDKHVSKGKRGFEPAHIFKDLTMKIFSMF